MVKYKNFFFWNHLLAAQKSLWFSIIGSRPHIFQHVFCVYIYIYIKGPLHAANSQIPSLCCVHMCYLLTVVLTSPVPRPSPPPVRLPSPCTTQPIWRCTTSASPPCPFWPTACWNNTYPSRSCWTTLHSTGNTLHCSSSAYFICTVLLLKHCVLTEK